MLKSRLRHVSVPEGVVIAGAVVAALVGLALIGEGLLIKAKAVAAQLLLDRAFAAGSAGGVPVKPWPWADTWPVARIEVPRLAASAIVLAGASGEALAFGPGHLAGTPQPGEAGAAVFAAHRDTHFAFLGKLAVGDRVAVTRADGRRFIFEVTGRRIARFDRSGIDAAAVGRRLALVTCWPIEARGRGPLRLIVEAMLVPSAEGDATARM